MTSAVDSGSSETVEVQGQDDSKKGLKRPERPKKTERPERHHVARYICWQRESEMRMGGFLPFNLALNLALTVLMTRSKS